MKKLVERLDSPLFAAIMLIAFLVLCYHCYPAKERLLIMPDKPVAQQQGYNQQQVKQMNSFVAFKVKQAKIETFRRDIISLYGNQN